MHILDVISSVSISSKCTKIVGGRGFVPDPTGGVYSAFAYSLNGFNGAYFKALLLRGQEGKEKKWRGDAKMIYAPGARNPRAVTDPAIIC